MLLASLIVVLLAEGSNMTGDALVGEHYILLVFDRPMNVLFCETKPFRDSFSCELGLVRC
jgi:hypothetical protein